MRKGLVVLNICRDWADF